MKVVFDSATTTYSENKLLTVCHYYLMDSQGNLVLNKNGNPMDSAIVELSFEDTSETVRAKLVDFARH